MAFIFRRKNNCMIEHMSSILQLVMQRVLNEKLLRELEGLQRGIKNLAPSGLMDVKKTDKLIVVNLNEIKDLVDEGAPYEQILALTTETGLRLLEREQKCAKTSKLKNPLRR